MRGAGHGGQCLGMGVRLVVGGVLRPVSNPQSPGPRRRDAPPGARRLVVHPGYIDDGEKRSLDLALIELDQPVLAADEIRLTCCGSGNPIVRRGQAATSWLVEVGNGDKLIFDVGGGSGTYTIAFLEASPEMSATLFDLPDVVSMGRARITNAGLMDRVR